MQKRNIMTVISKALCFKDQNSYMFKVKFHYYTTIKNFVRRFKFAQKTYSTGIPWDASRMNVR